MTDGRVRTYIGGRNFALGFSLKKGRNVFKGYFRRLGCRYISLFAFTNYLKVYDFSVISTDYPLNVIEKSFENPLDKKIYDASVKTLEVCMHEHYEDTPWREQALYAMDSRNQMLCGYIAFKEYAFARASLKLLSENVRKDGLFTLTSPKSTGVEQLTIPCFSLVQFCAMKEYAENSGDFSLFSEYKERYKTVLENFLSKVHKDGKIKELEGIYRWNFYEWGDDMDGNFLVPAKNRYASPLSAFLVMATDAFIYLSRKTGGYDGEYDAVKESLIRGLSEFYDCEKGVYATYIDGESGEKEHYSELANSLIIVATGVSERHNKIAEILRGQSFLQPITLSHSIYKYAALLSCGGAENEKSVLNEVRRRWGAMLDRGATTFYEDERGEAAFNDAGSLSHGWSAVPVFVYDKIFG